MSDRTLPNPPITPESEPFYDAAKVGRFLLRRCTACGAAHWYPRALCPFCFGETAWEDASGDGEIYTFSVMRRVAPAYVIAYVKLDEGPIMMTNIVEADPDVIAIGRRVRLVFVPSENATPIPCFRLTEPDAPSPHDL